MPSPKKPPLVKKSSGKRHMRPLLGENLKYDEGFKAQELETL